MQHSGVTTARDLPGHGKLGQQLDLLHYFYLDLNGLGCKHCDVQVVLQWFLWPLLSHLGLVREVWCFFRTLRTVLSLQKAAGIAEKEGEICASPTGEMQRCTAMYYDRVLLTCNKKGWIQQSRADSVCLKTAVLFFCLSLSSGFPLGSWNYFFVAPSSLLSVTGAGALGLFPSFFFPSPFIHWLNVDLL